MKNFVKSYKDRGYVKHIKRGHWLFWAGFPLIIMITIITGGSPWGEVIWATGGLWAFLAGLAHYFDSKARIRILKMK